MSSSFVNSIINTANGDQTNYYFTEPSLELDLLQLQRASVASAAYNSLDRYPPPRCVSGTRESLISAVDEWISASTSQTPICWINGHAGSGKSAIMQTIAESCAEKNILAASFFFSRGHEDRCNARRLFPTIAYQLCISSIQLRVPIYQALRRNPSILDSFMHDQLRDLIVNPLLSLDNPIQPLRVVIIDALDECDDQQSARDIIALFGHTLRQHPSLLKLIITSRPEYYIQAEFRDSQLSSMSYSLNLNHLDAHNDIRSFLVHRFKEICQRRYTVMRSVLEPWPLKRDIDKLVQQSSGLFIYASTILEFVAHTQHRPDQRLAIVLGDSPPSRLNSSPNATLDKLYHQVLSVTPISEMDRLRLVLGTIILLFEPLPLNGLQHLLRTRLDHGDVLLTLEKLYSVLHIPEDEQLAIRISHESFRDFLTNKDRADGYFIDPVLHHADMARYCLGIMVTELKRDICGIADPSKLNNEVTDLDRRRDECISGGLCYACRYWANHLSKASVLDHGGLTDDLQRFARTVILYWIEALSLLGLLKSAIPSLQYSQEWLQHTSSHSPEVLDLLHEAERLVLAFFDPISEAALHVYHSALPFIPNDSPLRRVFFKEFTASVQVLVGLEKMWNPCLRVIQCTTAVKSVAFSSDGAHLASGTADGTVQIWDAATGAWSATLEGHSKSVISLAFAPHNALLASGSEDSSIRLWDIATGCSPSILPGQPGYGVISLEFSADGTRLVSAIQRLNCIPVEVAIKLWGVENRCLISDLSHSPLAIQHACSHNQSFLSTPPTYSRHGYYRPITFSLDGTLFAHKSPAGHEWVYMGPRDKYDRPPKPQTFARTQSHPGWLSVLRHQLVVRSIDEPSFPIRCRLHNSYDKIETVAFSPDNKRIAGTTPDSDGILWDAATGALLNRLPNHRSHFNSIHFSPNGTHIASGSDDGTIRLWDASAVHSTMSRTQPSLCLDGVRQFRISRDGTRVAIWTIVDDTIGDHFVTIWNYLTNEKIIKLKGIFEIDSVGIMKLAFSSDHRLLAMSSRCQRHTSYSASRPSFDLWSIETGDILRTLYLEDNPMFSNLSFCCHDTVIACCFAAYGLRHPNLGTLALLDIKLGSPTRLIHSVFYNGYWKGSIVVISPDGALVARGYPATDPAAGSGTILVWDANNGQCISAFDDPDLAPQPVKFCISNGDTVCIVSTSRTHCIPPHLISPTTLAAIRGDQYHHYHIRDDGWLYDSTRRICWIPKDNRGELQPEPSLGHTVSIVFSDKSKAPPLILDFSHAF